MSLQELNKEFIKLQNKYGAKELDAICSGGLADNPDICFVFMNPTGRNLSASKSWKGLKAPWIGIKSAWNLFYELNLINKNIYHKIRNIKGSEWTEEFADEVYQSIANHKVYITNLGKCTQLDARPLPDSVYEQYLGLLFKEIESVNPKKIILFGNQVSSIVLGEKISVSQVRKQRFEKQINGKKYNFYSVYYPIGNGRINIDKAIEDLQWIIKDKELVAT